MPQRIVATADTLGGKPRIDGTRISVEFILELLAGGASRQDILDGYPHIMAEGLDAALRYAARSMKNETVWDVKLPA